MARRLTKQDKHSLATHLSWLEWGERFGFRLYGSNDEWYGHFTLPNGDNFIVPKSAREAIDARIAQ